MGLPGCLVYVTQQDSAHASLTVQQLLQGGLGVTGFVSDEHSYGLMQLALTS